MKRITVDMPDQMVLAVEEFIKEGYFDSEPDVFLAAINEFVRRNRVDLMEKFELDDIEWARKASANKK